MATKKNKKIKWHSDSNIYNFRLFLTRNHNVLINHQEPIKKLKLVLAHNLQVLEGYQIKDFYKALYVLDKENPVHELTGTWTDAVTAARKLING